MPPDEDPVDPLELTELVKSRILDRVLRDLAEDSRLGRPHSHYTKSASGVYGKYEKIEDQPARVLEIVQAEFERLLAELEARTREDETGEPAAPGDR